MFIFVGVFCRSGGVSCWVWSLLITCLLGTTPCPEEPPGLGLTVVRGDFWGGVGEVCSQPGEEREGSPADCRKD